MSRRREGLEVCSEELFRARQLFLGAEGARAQEPGERRLGQ